VLSSPEHQELYSVLAVTEDAKTEFTLTGKTGRVQLAGENLLDHFLFGLRTVVVFAESERLDWGEAPLTDPIRGDRVVLDRTVEGLAAGRLLIVEGNDAATGDPAREVVTLSRTERDGAATRLVLTRRLGRDYQRDTVKIYANVVPATHGELRTEIVGSGDGSRAFQKFALKQKPLTYVSSPTPGGIASTLEVRVNKLLWQEVPSLHGRGPGDRVYVTRLADDGTVTVVFGDGVTGARPPTGTENITASYRVGIGAQGLVDAHQISLLLTRPLGLNTVVNPDASTGAADPEELADAGQNAPLTVLTLDRIVSLQDFEDFVRAFAGVGKARATSLWNGERQIVHVTVSGADGAAIPQSSALYQNLRRAIDSARHQDQPLQIDSYLPVSFDVSASILVEAQYVADDVFDAVRSALIDRFSFATRAFAQAVLKSEVLAVMQGVAGVRAVDLDALFVTGMPEALNASLPARGAFWDQGTIRPAELITIRADGISLEVMA
jgi:predicted phage baseplate assembly protein